MNEQEQSGQTAPEQVRSAHLFQQLLFFRTGQHRNQKEWQYQRQTPESDSNSRYGSQRTERAGTGPTDYGNNYRDFCMFCDKIHFDYTSNFPGSGFMPPAVYSNSFFKFTS